MNELEIWRIDLGSSPDLPSFDLPQIDNLVFRTAPSSSAVELQEFLSDAERQRSRLLRSSELRRRFIVARGSLRRILADYLDLDPRQVEFLGGPNTKPKLKEPNRDLRFNLSHSKNLALVAVTHGREVGVDLEWEDPRIDVEPLARRFLAPEERGYLDFATAGTGSAARQEFFRLWTLREAYLKGLGKGLSVPLEAFAVSGPNDPRTRLLRSDFGDTSDWALTSFTPAKGFSGALAVQVT